MTSLTSMTEWTSVIPLKVTEAVAKGAVPNFATVESRDICTFIKQNQKHHMNRLYLCKESFQDQSEQSLQALKEYIIDVAIEHDCGLSKGGWVPSGGDSKHHRIQCRYFRRYQKKKTDHRSTSSYKPSSMSNDRRANSRGPSGKTQSRRTDCERELLLEDCCPFRINIAWDDNIGAWYIPISSRQAPKHTCNKHGGFHSKYQSFLLPEDLSEEQLQHLQFSLHVDTPIATVKKSFETTYSRGISRESIQKVQNKGFPKFTGTDVNQALQYLQWMKHDHVVLKQDYLDGPLVSNGATIGLSSSTAGHDMEQKYSEYTKRRRLELGLSSDEELIIGMLWVRKEDRILFRRCPHVLKVDTTFNTNEYGRPLWVATSKTAENTIFCVAYAVVPNEQMWVFNWLFYHALGALLQQELQQVRLIISDGDSTEIGQINEAMSKYMPNAIRLRCVWHITDRTWYRDVYSFPSKLSSRQNFVHAPQESSRLLLVKWASSWATSTCETEEEMRVSIQLFSYVLASEEMKMRFQLLEVASISTWANKVVSIVGDFAYYKRVYQPALEECSNSTQEASFSALKKKGAGLNRGRNMLSMFQILERKSQEWNLKYKTMNEGTRKQPWAGQLAPVTRLLTRYGGRVLFSQWRLASTYQSMWKEEVRAFYVWGKDLDEEDEKKTSLRSIEEDMGYEEDSVVDDGEEDGTNGGEDRASSAKALFLDLFIPRFKRVRLVSVMQNGELTCSCGFPQRNFMPCRHQIHVLHVYERRMPKITDVHQRWHKDYQYRAYGSEHNSSLDTDKFGPAFEDCEVKELLRQNEYMGPMIDTNNCETFSDVTGPDTADRLPSFFGKPAKERVVNWDVKHTLQICGAKKTKKAVVGMGLSQDVHKFEEEYDYSQVASQEIGEAIGSKLSQVTDVKEMEDMMGGSKQKPGRTTRTRSSLDAYHTLKPLFAEIMNTIDQDPSKIRYFQEMMNNSLQVANADIMQNKKRKNTTNM
eukprot:CAMPEP_0113631180 /NCGR_PEP_ID=MMETSP0017_2-20120614/16203_1 /TAXON_ID=2856 /ORGANISM="Cylindrotheca closterium" /LENGTH=982 /DNA_ID=CAMNT_0000541679 /DNA_START=1 /DNA_END=2952 /DNA_ORIENTATION=- /assembly_acc=CAM_ASM_000147